MLFCLLFVRMKDHTWHCHFAGLGKAVQKLSELAKAKWTFITGPKKPTEKSDAVRDVEKRWSSPAAYCSDL